MLTGEWKKVSGSRANQASGWTALASIPRSMQHCGTSSMYLTRREMSPRMPTPYFQTDRPSRRCRTGSGQTAYECQWVRIHRIIYLRLLWIGIINTFPSQQNCNIAMSAVDIVIVCSDTRHLQQIPSSNSISNATNCWERKCISMKAFIRSRSRVTKMSRSLMPLMSNTGLISVSLKSGFVEFLVDMSECEQLGQSREQ